MSSRKMWGLHFKKSLACLPLVWIVIDTSPVMAKGGMQNPLCGHLSHRPRSALLCRHICLPLASWFSSLCCARAGAGCMREMRAHSWGVSQMHGVTRICAGAGAPCGGCTHMQGPSKHGWGVRWAEGTGMYRGRGMPGEGSKGGFANALHYGCAHVHFRTLLALCRKG